MSKGVQAIITICALLALFLIFGFTAEVKEQVYTTKELCMVTEKYIDLEPYETTEQYTVSVPYTYTAPCTEQYGLSYGGCCRPPGVPGNMIGSYQYPTPGNPDYNPYSTLIREPVKYCEKIGIRDETKTRTVTKWWPVEKTRQVRDVCTVTKKRTVSLFTPPPPAN